MHRYPFGEVKCSNCFERGILPIKPIPTSVGPYSTLLAMNLNLNPPIEDVKFMIMEAREKCEKETGKRTDFNLNPINYESLRDELNASTAKFKNEKSGKFPADHNHPLHIRRVIDVTSAQLRDAYLMRVIGIKPYVIAALNIYLHDSLNPPITDIPHPSLRKVIIFIVAGVLGTFVTILNALSHRPAEELALITEGLNIFVLVFFWNLT